MICDRFDVVVVPFPFTDTDRSKRRPALVVSDAAFNDAAAHSVMAMITSAANPPWPRDAAIHDLDAAGLPAPSVVRMKFFTLDNRLILRRCGLLGDEDRRRVTAELKTVLDL